MRLAFGAVVMLSVLLAGCGTVERADLVGAWVVRYSFGIEILQLKENDEYLQVIVLDDSSTVATHSGRWSYEANSSYIKLENALEVQDAFGKLEQKWNVPFDGLVLTHASRLFPWSRVELQSAKEGLVFVKVE